MKTVAIKCDAAACCPECGGEAVNEDAWKWARNHARQTGHCPTVTQAYDVWRDDLLTNRTGTLVIG